MSVVMAGQYAFWLNYYNRTQKAVELTTNDLNSTVAREGADRGQYVRDESVPGDNGKPMFVATDRTDPNNPLYKIIDSIGAQPKNAAGKDKYSVDSNGNILYLPTNVAYQGAWFSGNFAGTGRTVNFATDSYAWFPDDAINPAVGDQPIYLGRSFMLDKVDPASSSFQRGGTVYMAVDNHARVYVNGTFVGEGTGFSAPTAPTELVIPPNLLRVGENVITFQATNAGAAGPGNPGGISITADIGGIDGRGAGFGGVTLTTRAAEIDSWSVSKRSVSGLMGKVAFEVRQGAALTTRTDQIGRMGAVLQTLSGMLGATSEQDQLKFRALR